MNTGTQIYPFSKTLLLVGMMGCGKTSIGLRLSKIYELPFVDADSEIEKASGLSVVDLFEKYGEDEFRRGEERVMERLLNGPVCILSSGGGAFMSEKTRDLARQKTISLFLDADIETLIRNTTGRSHRPLLNTENPEETVKKLHAERYETYRQADLHVSYKNEGLAEIVRRVAETVRDKKP